MTKVELVNAMMEKMATKEVGATKKGVAAMLDAFMDSVTDALVADEKVTLVGFGTFETIEKDERTARNPRTGEQITVPAHKVPKFKFSPTVKNLVR